MFGNRNTVIPAAPQVNDVDFNTIALIGIAPKGPTQTLTVCGSDTDDAAFGKCLTGFNIPRALDTLRAMGAGKVVVNNVFDSTAHTTLVTNENVTITAQKGATAFNPTNVPVVTNTPVTPVSESLATAALAVTVGATLGDTLESLKVGLIDIIDPAYATTPYSFTGTSVGATRGEIVTLINAYTSTSGFSAAGGSGGAFTITANTGSGATLNGVVTTIGTIVGALAIGTNNAFSGGVTAIIGVSPVTYVAGTDYTIDEYGKLLMLIAISDSTILRVTYRKLNATAVNAAAIIGDVVADVRTGCKLIDSCKTILGLVPKILIIPGYNSDSSVRVEMDRLTLKYRMRAIYGATAGMTLSQAIASRGPGGTLATFNTSDKRSILVFPQVKTYDPQSATLTLDDPSAAFAGFLAWNAAVNGPHISTSNQVMPAVGDVEINLLHDWEDPSNAGQTNQLRAAGIACAFSDGGFKWWGAENASYPANTAVDQNICTIYVNDVLTDALTAFAIQYIDRNITSGSIAAFLTAANGYYSSKMTAGWIGTDSTIKFLKERNPPTDLAAGKIRFTRNTFYFVGMKLIELEENMEVQLPSL